MRTWVAVAMVGLVVIAAEPGLAARPAACTTITDRAGDIAAGATGPEERLDLLAGQVWVQGGTLSVRIRLKTLAAPAVPGSVGVQYAVRFSHRGEVYELAANVDPTATTFVAHLYGGEGASAVALPGGDIPIDGALDAERGTVRMEVPVTVLGALRPVRAGSTVSELNVTSSRWFGSYATGGVVRPADGARRLEYVLGRSC